MYWFVVYFLLLVGCLLVVTEKFGHTGIVTEFIGALASCSFHFSIEQDWPRFIPHFICRVSELGKIVS